MKTVRLLMMVSLLAMSGCAIKRDLDNDRLELPGWDGDKGWNWYFWQSKPKQEPLPGSENWDSFHNELKK